MNATPSRTPATRPVVTSSRPIESPQTGARIDPARCVRADGDDDGAVWVAVVGSRDDVEGVTAKSLAQAYAFDGRTDVGISRTYGPLPDDGTVAAPPADSSSAMSGVIMDANQRSQMAAAASLGRGSKTFVTFYLVRPAY